MNEIYYLRELEGNVIAEYDGAGNLLSEYVYANGQRIAKMDPDGSMDYYLNDHAGGPAQVPGSARAMVGSGWSANYYPFGEIDSQTGSEEDTHFDFTGQERDRETGLMYFGARYYRSKAKIPFLWDYPAIGRWLSVDPSAEKYPSLNPYGYCANNPLVYIDPAGESYYYVMQTGFKEETYTDAEGHIKTAHVSYTYYTMVYVDDGKNDIIKLDYSNPVGDYKINDIQVVSSEIGNQTGNTQENSSNGVDKLLGPLATENDSWFRKLWRGTGNLQEDMKSFVIGVPAISIGLGAVAWGSAAAAPLVVSEAGLVAGSGTVISEGVTAGYGIASAEVGVIGSWIVDTGFQGVNLYLINKPVVDNSLRSTASHFSKGAPGAIAPTNVHWDLFWGILGKVTGY